MPGIEFSHDPVLQGRAFAYRDTDYHRLGTANLNEIPINQPIVDVNTNHRDGYVKHRIDTDPVTYHKNSLAENTPSATPPADGGFAHYPAAVEGEVTRELPSGRFDDHFSQARMFWNSLAAVERDDLVETFAYHLGKVKSRSVRQQTVDMFGNVDTELASALARRIGVEPPSGDHVPVTESSPALSLMNTAYSPQTQRVGVLVGEGFDGEEVSPVLEALERAGCFIHVVGDRLGAVDGTGGASLQADETFITAHPALFDAYFIAGGRSEEPETFDEHIEEFLRQGYRSCKPIAIATAAQHHAPWPDDALLSGVILAGGTDDLAGDFCEAVGRQRFWDR